jgi:hypothetical protein
MPNRPPLAETFSPTRRQSIDDAAYWLDRAEEIQTIAESMSHPDTRVLMLDLADSYKRMAERALVRGKQKS